MILLFWNLRVIRLNKLEKLIKNLCPDGVEVFKLETITNKIFSGGTPNSNSKDYYNGNIPWLRSGEIKFKAIKNTELNITDSGFKASSAKWVLEKSVLMAMTGANVAKVAFNEIPLTTNQSCACIEVKKEIICYKFLFYYLSDKYIENKHSGQGALTSLNLGHVKKMLIPVPPLEIQKEIVRILDSFTELEAELDAELEAELEARTKQYEYYRNKLLDFSTGFVGLNKIDKMIKELCPNGINAKKLDDIGYSFFRGTGIKRNQISDDGFPCIRYGDIYTKYTTWFSECKIFTNESLIKNPKYMEKGDIVFAITGEKVDEIGKSVAYIGNQSVMVGGDIVVMKHKENPKFIAYCLETNNLRKQKSNRKTKSKVVHMSLADVKGLTVYLPPIKIQDEIVNILDNFSSLTKSLSEGLSTEIKARKQQYEYYRNKLLTFKERQ